MNWKAYAADSWISLHRNSFEVICIISSNIGKVDIFREYIFVYCRVINSSYKTFYPWWAIQELCYSVIIKTSLFTTHRSTIAGFLFYLITKLPWIVKVSNLKTNYILRRRHKAYLGIVRLKTRNKKFTSLFYRRSLEIRWCGPRQKLGFALKFIH